MLSIKQRKKLLIVWKKVLVRMKDLLDGVKNPLDDYYIVTIEDSSQI